MFEASSLPVEWWLAPLPVVLDIPLILKSGQFLRQREVAFATLSFAGSDVVRADQHVVARSLVFAPVHVVMSYFPLGARRVKVCAVHTIVAGTILPARLINIVNGIPSANSKVASAVWKAPASVEAVLSEKLLFLSKLYREFELDVTLHKGFVFFRKAQTAFKSRTLVPRRN